MSFAARDVLQALDRPRSVEEIHELAHQPVYRVRASLREMGDLGLVVAEGDLYSMTDAGKAKLAEPST